MRLLKLADKYTGWQCEHCYAQHGRRFAKRLEHRYNRRYGRKMCRCWED
jgi:hypothetical protein